MLLNSGTAVIFRGRNAAPPGGKPKIIYDTKITAEYYGEKTVGISRYWTAKAHDARADLLIELPLLPDVTEADRCKLYPYFGPTGGTYKIVQVQHVTDDDGQPCTDLTLERIGGIDDA